MAEDRRDSSRGSARKQQRRRQRSVFQYITILFAAALVLLFYTYMMERRQYEQQDQQHQANINDLQQQSVSAVQTLQGMSAENELLKRQLDDLTQQLEEAKAERDDAQSKQAQLHSQLQIQERAAQAMDWFWQIDEAYVRGKSSLCRELIDAFEGSGLSTSLPQLSVTGTDRFSPAERYLEIYEEVVG